MEITDVRVRKVAKEGKMKAVVSITFDNEFVVHDIKVIEGEKGLFIAMPSRKALDGELEISPIRSIRPREISCKELFWISMRPFLLLSIMKKWITMKHSSTSCIDTLLFRIEAEVFFVRSDKF